MRVRLLCRRDPCFSGGLIQSPSQQTVLDSYAPEFASEFRRAAQTAGGTPPRSFMAATYDPGPRAPLGFRVPFNLESGETIQQRWRARLLSARLSAAGVRHTYEEFDDNHSGIDYRMDVSLPIL